MSKVYIIKHETTEDDWQTTRIEVQHQLVDDGVDFVDVVKHLHSENAGLEHCRRLESVAEGPAIVGHIYKETLNDMRAELKEAKTLLSDIYQDLLADHGCNVVNLSNSLWLRLKELIGDIDE